MGAILANKQLRARTAGKAKGPYDVIVVEGALAAIPETLFAQLKPDGRLVALIAEPGRPASGSGSCIFGPAAAPRRKLRGVRSSRRPEPE